MISTILCEGKSDAIILGYILIAEYSYNFLNTKDAFKYTRINVLVQNQEQEVYWYKNNENIVCVCSVGGKDNFLNFLNLTLLPPNSILIFFLKKQKLGKNT